MHIERDRLKLKPRAVDCKSGIGKKLLFILCGWVWVWVCTYAYICAYMFTLPYIRFRRKDSDSSK